MFRLLPTFFLLLFLVNSAQSQQSPQVSPWILEAADVDPNNYFGITVANGKIGIISNPEFKQDGDAGAFLFSAKDIVVNGAYDTYGRGRVSNILKVFNFANVGIANPYFTEKEKKEFDQLFAESNKISERQWLNMQTATFSHEIDYRDLTLRFDLRALRQLPNNGLISVTIKAKKAITLAPIALIRAPDILRDLETNYTEIPSGHHPNIPLMTSYGWSPNRKMEIASTISFLFESGESPGITHQERHRFQHSIKFVKSLQKDESFTFHVVGTIMTSEQGADTYNESERLTIFAALEGAGRLIEKHEAAWKELWKSDILIEGDAQAQQDVHSALYHLYAFVRAGTSYSLSPMGLSGLGYNGHVFWDTEIWMYPPLLLLQPEMARSLLDYRFDRLEMAKLNARNHGYAGAMYPWESDDTGQEATPVWALTGPFEHHISGDIAWAFWKYFEVTGDTEWLEEKGYVVLKEIADFWISRVDEVNGVYHINNVVGADEYAENINNNAYTNGVAIKSLEYATRAAQVLGLTPNPQWAIVAQGIPLQKMDNGVTSEYDGYDGRIIKQADVNLLAYPLDVITDRRSIEKDLHYYESRIDENGPAMGYSVLSILYNTLGDRDRSYDLFVKGYKPNAAPPFGVLAEFAGGSNPYFGTGAGGMLQAVLAGFGGLRITDQGIKQIPSLLPEKWTSLTLQGIGIHEANFQVK
ncbi:MAG: glycoside hydrolase family 65 protein [Saprospiraceae bacterium]|nr:glycoside hydrolase family 65 protein [Saprospiraceae bacterium]